MEKYQVAILGGGPGGYEAAIRCAKLGLKTVLIEKDALGGTCLNRGCIPTKALLHSSELYSEAASGGTMGVRAEGLSFDYGKIAGRKDKVIKRLVGGIAYLMQANGVDVVNGFGVLQDKNTISVGDSVINAENIILATGSVPVVPPIPGGDCAGVLDSTGVLALTECPERVIIIGGGVIGIEFATMFAQLGKKVTVIEMLPVIMGSDTDAELSAAVCKYLKKKKVDIQLGGRVLEIKDGPVVVYEKDGDVKEVSGDIAVMAVGRKPFTSGCGLENVGICTDDKGFVCIDDNMRTSVPNIYAIGDITGKIQLAHVASAQGCAAAHTIAGEPKTVDYASVPTCIYTEPEVACVGLTEAQAAAAGKKVKVGMFPMAGNGRSLVLDKTNGFAKVVAEESSGQIIGAQLYCANATDMIATFALAMHAHIDIETFASTVFPHPTVSEAIGEAAHDVFGLSNNKG